MTECVSRHCPMCSVGQNRHSWLGSQPLHLSLLSYQGEGCWCSLITSDARNVCSNVLGYIFRIFILFKWLTAQRREITLICCFPHASNSKAEPGCSQEPGTQCRSPVWMAIISCLPEGRGAFLRDAGIPSGDVTTVPKACPLRPVLYHPLVTYVEGLCWFCRLRS